MALELGNLLGAAANLTTAVASGKSLKKFLSTVDDFGIQVQNNYEVNIAGLEDITFFAQSIDFGSISRSFHTLFYQGRSIPVQTYVDYDHKASMRVLNDAQGYIYAAVSNFLMKNDDTLVDNGVVMTIKCLTGDKNYKGSLITLNNVKIENLSGLSFGYDQNSVSTFNIDFNYLDFVFTPGALQKAAGVLGTIERIIA